MCLLSPRQQLQRPPASFKVGTVNGFEACPHNAGFHLKLYSSSPRESGEPASAALKVPSPSAHEKAAASHRSPPDSGALASRDGACLRSPFVPAHCSFSSFGFLMVRLRSAGQMRIQHMGAQLEQGPEFGPQKGGGSVGWLEGFFNRKWMEWVHGDDHLGLSAALFLSLSPWREP